ncbi:hypothetical protein LCGC14_3100240 [marine sediment metagenome]|uniref:Uncharacterized protein n=1 Tax=marine sediment metagenome TaxID=412755 RepID=A0A0F8W7Z7_9ZZZZ
MNYLTGIFVVCVTSAIATLLGQIPYKFLNQAKLKDLNDQKKEIKAKLKEPRIVDADDGVYEGIQKELMKTNWEVSRRVMLPLICQFGIIIFVLDKLRQLNPMFLWLIWYIGFSILFNRVWKKVIGVM